MIDLYRKTAFSTRACRWYPAAFLHRLDWTKRLSLLREDELVLATLAIGLDAVYGRIVGDQRSYPRPRRAEGRHPTPPCDVEIDDAPFHCPSSRKRASMMSSWNVLIPCALFLRK